MAKVALPALTAMSEAPGMATPLSRNVTVPRLPGFGEIVAVKLTESPWLDGFVAETSAVVVVALTTCVTTFDVLPAKPGRRCRRP